MASTTRRAVYLRLQRPGFGLPMSALALNKDRCLSSNIGHLTEGVSLPESRIRNSPFNSVSFGITFHIQPPF